MIKSLICNKKQRNTLRLKWWRTGQGRNTLIWFVVIVSHDVVCASINSWWNVIIAPVWKHGPRSPTWLKVFGWIKPKVRSESKTSGKEETPAPLSPSDSSLDDWEKWINHVGTRKRVNYTWSGWSQRKLWWKFSAVLTCKLFVRVAYRGERLIELSSSWFPPKFPWG